MLPDTQYEFRELEVHAYITDAPAEANIFPSALNLIDDMDLLCPLSMSFVLYAGIPSELDVLEGPAVGGGDEGFSECMAMSSSPPRVVVASSWFLVPSSFFIMDIVKEGMYDGRGFGGGSLQKWKRV